MRRILNVLGAAEEIGAELTATLAPSEKERVEEAVTAALCKDVQERVNRCCRIPRMCGRVSTTTALEQIAAFVGARGPLPPWRPRYNQPPGEPVANVIELNGKRQIEAFHWGIRGRDPKRWYINIRGESVPKSRAFASRRSLVFVDGFYEWDRKKQPYHVRQRGGELLALAAVYDESPERRRFAIITTRPNRTVGEIHGRMPAILPEDAWNAWLDPRYPDYDELRGLLRPFPDEPLVIYPVSRLANSPRNDRPELLEPVGHMPRIVELAQKVRQLLEPQNEKTAIGIAQALRISEDEAHEVLQALGREIDQRGGRYFLTKWKR